MVVGTLAVVVDVAMVALSGIVPGLAIAGLWTLAASVALVAIGVG